MLTRDDIHQLIVGKADDEPVVSTSKQEAVAMFEERYPLEERWRLLVDGYLYAKSANNEADPLGWVNYEAREPGCVSAYYAAGEFCLNKLKSTPGRIPLELAFIYQLLELVTDGVKLSRNEEKSLKNVRTGFMTFSLGEPSYYHVVTKIGLKHLLESFKCYHSDILYSKAGDLLTDQGFAFIKYDHKKKLITALRERYSLNQLQNKKELNNAMLNLLGTQYDNVSGYYNFGFSGIKISCHQSLVSVREQLKVNSVDSVVDVLFENMQEKGHRILYVAPEVFLIEFLLKKTIDNYNDRLPALTTDSEKLVLIGETIEACERIHPFSDANGRTFVNLLLNYLLMQEGFPPATLFEPNVYDAFGHHQEVLMAGMRNTLAIYQGERCLFGFSLGTESTLAKTKMANMLQEVAIRSFSMLISDALEGMKRAKSSPLSIFSPPAVDFSQLLEALKSEFLVNACRRLIFHSVFFRVKSQLETLEKILGGHEAVMKALNDFLEVSGMRRIVVTFKKGA